MTLLDRPVQWELTEKFHEDMLQRASPLPLFSFLVLCQELEGDYLEWAEVM